MGNQSSGQQFGQIYVQTDKPTYYQGDTIQGNVYLNLIMPFPAKDVDLKIKGRETAEWTETRQRQVQNSDGTYRVETYEVQFDQKNQFYNHKIKLHNFGGMIPPGQYCFPFCFMIDNWVPGTIDRKSKKCTAVIKYKIKADIEPLEKSLPKIKYTQQLQINQKPNQIIQTREGTSTVDMSTWCCLSKGPCTIKGYVDKDAYAPHEVANTVCEADCSNCQIGISKVAVRLQQRLTLHADGHTRVIETCVSETQMPGIGPGDKKVGFNDAIRQSLKLQVRTKRGEYVQLQPSTNGKLVKQEYFIDIKAEFEECTCECCCGKAPKCQFPVVIYAAPPLYYGQVQQPPNWQPQVMPQVQFTLDPSYCYGSSKGGMPNNNAYSNTNQVIQQQPIQQQPMQQQQIMNPNAQYQQPLQQQQMMDPNAQYQQPMQIQQQI